MKSSQVHFLETLLALPTDLRVSSSECESPMASPTIDATSAHSWVTNSSDTVFSPYNSQESRREFTGRGEEEHLDHCLAGASLAPLHLPLELDTVLGAVVYDRFNNVALETFLIY